MEVKTGTSNSTSLRWSRFGCTSMKLNLTVLFSFFIIGCSEIDLLEISNEGRSIKLTEVYDCRTQRRHPWGDSPHSQVLVHLIDFSNQTKIFHVGYYKNTILETPYEYLLKDSTDDNHQFEQFIYDLTDINESNNFIRFSTMNEKGNKTTYVLNKQNNTLIFDRDLPDEWSEKISRLNMSEEWLKKNTGYGWTRTCKII